MGGGGWSEKPGPEWCTRYQRQGKAVGGVFSIGGGGVNSQGMNGAHGSIHKANFREARSV